MMLQTQKLLVDGIEKEVPGISFEDAKQFLLSQAWFNREKYPVIEPIKESLK